MTKDDQRVIAVNGELGSGKTSVSIALAARLSLERVGTGDLQRSVARRMRMSTLDLNRYAEQHQEIDDLIDGSLRKLATLNRPMVVDSRLAWHFIPGALKIHLTVDPVVGAQRVFSRDADASEKYASFEDTYSKLLARRSSERRRFKKLYGIDIWRLRNYHLVIDTTQASTELVVEKADRLLQREIFEDGEPQMLLDPKRLFPTQDIRTLARSRTISLVKSIADFGYDEYFPVQITASRSRFFIIDGHRRTSAAIKNDLPLIPAQLLAENGEQVIGTLSADGLAAQEVRSQFIYDWEAAHGFNFLTYPPAAGRPAR